MPFLNCPPLLTPLNYNNCQGRFFGTFNLLAVMKKKIWNFLTFNFFRSACLGSTMIRLNLPKIGTCNKNTSRLFRLIKFSGGVKYSNEFKNRCLIIEFCWFNCLDWLWEKVVQIRAKRPIICDLFDLNLIFTHYTPLRNR